MMNERFLMELAVLEIYDDHQRYSTNRNRQVVLKEVNIDGVMFLLPLFIRIRQIRVIRR